MASISVDVDLSDFDLDEILDELEYRYNSKWKDKEKNQKQINEFIKRMKIDCEDEGCNNLSLLDKMKIDFVINNLDKIKLNDLENLI
jgi:hypothetical protein